MLAVIAHGEDAQLPPYANPAVGINAAQIVYGVLSSELSGTPGLSVLDAAYDPAG